MEPFYGDWGRIQGYFDAYPCGSPGVYPDCILSLSVSRTGLAPNLHCENACSAPPLEMLLVSSVPTELMCGTIQDVRQVRPLSVSLFVIKPDVCQLCELVRELLADSRVGERQKIGSSLPRFTASVSGRSQTLDELTTEAVSSPALCARQREALLGESLKDVESLSLHRCLHSLHG